LGGVEAGPYDPKLAAASGFSRAAVAHGSVVGMDLGHAAELLGLEPGWLPRHLVAFGYPAPRPPAHGRSAVPGGRKALSQIYRDQ
jgi:hypothetical protein